MKSPKKVISIIAIISYVLVILFGLFNKISKELKEFSPEISENNEYITVGDPTVYGTDGNVEFSAFFVRDINGDGKDEKLLETFNDKESDVTLYSIDGEKNDYHGRAEPFYVQLDNRAGRLQKFNIRLYGSGYRFTTAQENYSGLMYNGSGMSTQTSFLGSFFSFNEKDSTYIRDFSMQGHVIKTGKIRNGENDEARIVLTGTYLNNLNQEVVVSKTIPLNVIWYGETNVDIVNTSQTKDIETAIDEENDTFTVNFEIDSTETIGEVELEKSFLGMGLPRINGKDLPILNMSVTGGNATFSRYENDMVFYMRENIETPEETYSIWDEGGITKYNVEIVYPLDAIKDLHDDALNIRVPVKAYYMDNAETTPYKTEIKDSTITVHYNKIISEDEKYDVKVGSKIYESDEEWIVSKDKPLRIYNGRSSNEINDLYKVRWYSNIGNKENENGLVMKSETSDRFVKSDTSAEEIGTGTSYRGIYFNNQENVLEEDGWIKVYDDETNELIGDFNRDNWFNYNAENPYMYKVATRNIRVETSKVKANRGLYVYNIKELYDEYITEKYTKVEFDDFNYIRSSFSTYLGEAFINTTEAQAKYQIVAESEPEQNENSNLSLKIIKTEKDTENRLTRVKYKVTGAGYEDGRVIKTNDNGEVTLEGLYLNEIYILEETKAEGYYLSEPILFVVNNDGINILSGTTKNATIDNSSVIPVAIIELEDEKIPTYNLQLDKIKRVTNVQTSQNQNNTEGNTEEVVHLDGAEFKLYKDDVELGKYITDSNGILTINNLYQYIEEKGVDQTYTLRETKTPAGYMKVNDIVFKVSPKEGSLEFIETLSKGQKAKNYTVEGNTVKVTVEDTATFKLIKKDSETGELLSNVKFALYDINSTEKPARDGNNKIVGTKEIINGEEFYTLSTDENGEIVVDLKDGLYKAVELMAPEKYDISKSVYYFGIGTEYDGKETAVKWQIENQSVIGGDGEDKIIDIAETPFGAVAIGTFEETITLGETQLESSGEKDGIIISYDQSNNISWSRSIGGIGNDTLTAVCATNDNGIIVVGSFETGISLSNGNILSNDGSTDGMIVKYNSNGIIQWARRIGGTGIDEITDVLENEDGDIFIGGCFSGTLTLDDNSTVTSKGLTDGMLVKYNSNGEFKFIKTFGGVGNDCVYSICETTDGSIGIGGKIAGKTSGSGSISVRFENNTSISCNLRYEKFVMLKYEKNGSFKWVKELLNYYYSNKYDFRLNSYSGNNLIVTYNRRIEKYNENGTLIGQKDIASRFVNTIFETRDNGIIIGYENKVIKYDKDFNVQLVKEFNENYIVNSAIEKSTREILVGGYTEDYDGIITELDYEESIMPLITFDNEIILEAQYDYFDLCDMIETSDGGFLTLCEADGELDLGNNIVLNPGMIIIKYNDDKKVEWARSLIDSGNYAYINSVNELENGDIFVDGSFREKLYLDEYDQYSDEDTSILTNGDTSSDAEMNIIFNSKGELKSAEMLQNEKKFYTSDGGFLVTKALGNNVQLRDGRLITVNNDLNNVYPEICLIKYNSNGMVEWIDRFKSMSVNINNILETNDNGFIAVGCFKEDLNLNNGIILNEYSENDESTYISDALIIKYNSKGQVEWGKSIGGNKYDELYDVINLKDGGMIVSGYFESDFIQLENGTNLTNKSDNFNEMFIKLTANGEIEWSKSMTGFIYCIKEMQDGSIVISGSFSGYECEIEDGYTLSSNYNSNGMIVKYSSNGDIQWSKVLSGNTSETICSVLELQPGKLTVAVNSNSSQLNIGNGKVLYNLTGYNRGIILDVQENAEVIERSELVVENERKEFRITTATQLVNGQKLGSISGENDRIYQTVKYGDNSTNPIVIVPNEGCEIAIISVNGKEIDFTPNADGSYTMPVFENITENKHIVVTFTSSENKITINNPDSITGDLLTDDLSGTVFEIKQYEEEFDDVIGEWQNLGDSYEVIDESKKVEGVVGKLTHKPEDEYYFVERNGQYIPTNSKTWQIENVDGATTGVDNSVAYSYVDIDLTGKSGKYMVKVNAESSCETEDDYGLIKVDREDWYSPYVITDLTGNTNANDYWYNKTNYSESLEGGQEYKLIFEYGKDSSTDEGEDLIAINSIDVYEVINYDAQITGVVGDFTSDSEYYFAEYNGKYIPTNSKTWQVNVEGATEGVKGTTARSTVEIDLTDKEGKYDIVVNTDYNGDMYNYGTITWGYSGGNYINSISKLPYYYGNSGEINHDNEIVLNGGYKYYIEFSYEKTSYSEDVDIDMLAINSIKVYKFNIDINRVGFKEDVRGRHVSNNLEYNNEEESLGNINLNNSTKAVSCVPIDLTNYTGEYNLFMNAEISALPYKQTVTTTGNFDVTTTTTRRGDMAYAFVSTTAPENVTGEIDELMLGGKTVVDNTSRKSSFARLWCNIARWSKILFIYRI